jgi:phage-related holin
LHVQRSLDAGFTYIVIVDFKIYSISHSLRRILNSSVSLMFMCTFFNLMGRLIRGLTSGAMTGILLPKHINT